MSDELEDGVGLVGESSGRLVIGGFILIFATVGVILTILARQPATEQDYGDAGASPDAAQVHGADATSDP
jgi:hypothetical protein